VGGSNSGVREGVRRPSGNNGGGNRPRSSSNMSNISNTSGGGNRPRSESTASNSSAGGRRRRQSSPRSRRKLVPRNWQHMINVSVLRLSARVTARYLGPSEL
jgi:hypothetical protein